MRATPFRDQRIAPEAVAGVNARFAYEAETLSLAYRCRDCLHFDDEAARCSLGFPLPPAWSAARAVARRLDGEYVFCKYFEML